MVEHPHGFRHAVAFGNAFVLLMSRLIEERRSLAEATGDESEIERARSRLSTSYELEVEALIARHFVPDPVAGYVRHVVREGFDVDFDPMDPAE